MNSRDRLSKDDIPYFAKLGGIFVAIGTVFGVLSGDGIIVGAVAGALMYFIMFGIGYLCTLLG